MIGHDKKVHFVMGITIGIVGGIACLVLGVDPWWAMVPVAVASIGKEAWDAAGHGTPEVLDFVATLAGGGLIVGIIKLLG